MKDTYYIIEMKEGYTRYYRVRQIVANSITDAYNIIERAKYRFGYEILISSPTAEAAFNCIDTRLRWDEEAGIRSTIATRQTVSL